MSKYIPLDPPKFSCRVKLFSGKHESPGPAVYKTDSYKAITLSEPQNKFKPSHNPIKVKPTPGPNTYKVEEVDKNLQTREIFAFRPRSASVIKSAQIKACKPSAADYNIKSDQSTKFIMYYPQIVPDEKIQKLHEKTMKQPGPADYDVTKYVDRNTNQRTMRPNSGIIRPTVDERPYYMFPSEMSQIGRKVYQPIHKDKREIKSPAPNNYNVEQKKENGGYSLKGRNYSETF